MADPTTSPPATSRTSDRYTLPLAVASGFLGLLRVLGHDHPDTLTSKAPASRACTRHSTPPDPAAGWSPRLRRARRVHSRTDRRGHSRGLDAARARGQRLGRPPAMTAEQIRHARDLLTRPDNTVSSIAGLLGVSRVTIYKYVPELPARIRPAAAPPRVPMARAGCPLTSAPVRFYADREAAGELSPRGDHAHLDGRSYAGHCGRRTVTAQTLRER